MLHGHSIKATIFTFKKKKKRISGHGIDYRLRIKVWIKLKIFQNLIMCLLPVMMLIKSSRQLVFRLWQNGVIVSHFVIFGLKAKSNE